MITFVGNLHFLTGGFDIFLFVAVFFYCDGVSLVFCYCRVLEFSESADWCFSSVVDNSK